MILKNSNKPLSLINHKRISKSILFLNEKTKDIVFKNSQGLAYIAIYNNTYEIQKKKEKDWNQVIKINYLYFISYKNNKFKYTKLYWQNIITDLYFVFNRFMKLFQIINRPFSQH